RRVKSRFFALADTLFTGLHAGEVLLCNLSAERSDFVRFNHARVRQAGSVAQQFLSLRLIRNRRQASALFALSGESEDIETARGALAKLRDALAQLPEDPLL